MISVSSTARSNYLVGRTARIYLTLIPRHETIAPLKRGKIMKMNKKELAVEIISGILILPMMWVFLVLVLSL